jgi:hypothetical protein
MPSSFVAAPAAVSGGISPALFAPSVQRIITLLLAGESLSRFAAVAIAVPIAVWLAE